MTKKRMMIAVMALTLFFGRSFGQSQETLKLSLEDCIAKALKNNLNLAVEVYNPEIARAALSRAKEVYMPRLDLNYNNQHQESPSYWFLQGSGTQITKMADYAATVIQQIPTGGNVSISLSSYKSDTNQAFQLINPRYGSTMRLDFKQPLLRSFGFTVNQQQINIARNNVEISVDQLKTSVLNTIYIVEEAYWNLAYAIENLKVKQQSLQLAKDLLAKNKKEVEVGAIAPIEVLNAEAVVAQREADIIQSEALIRHSEQVLRNIINFAVEGQEGPKKIEPSEAPVFVEKSVSMEAALNEALMRRPELLSAKKSMESSQLNVKVARNQLLPGLDFTFSYWSPGISGDRIIYAGDNVLSGVVIGTQKGSGSDSLRDAFKFQYPNFQVGLTLSIPLSNLISKADYVNAKLQLDQTLARLKTLEQQIRLEVSDTVRDIESNAKRFQAYRVARELAAKRLNAEQKKLNVGLTTNYFVLQYQDELASARINEFKALVDYNVSLVRLEKATGAALENRNIQISDIVK